MYIFFTYIIALSEVCLPLAIMRKVNPVVIVSLCIRNHFSKTSMYVPDCCYALQIHPMLTCKAVATSAFSSCEDLLKDKALAVVVWIIITLSVAGNLSSILIGATLKERDRTQRLLITNLGVSDLLNGVYLLIIAINDRRWAGQYFNKDREWRSSFLCNLTGFISMLSIQVSVFTLTAISTLRCIAVLSPLRFRGLTMKTTVATLTATWLVGIFLSIAPFLNDSYFAEDSVGFFRGRLGVSSPAASRRATEWLGVRSGGIRFPKYTTLPLPHRRLCRPVLFPPEDTDMPRLRGESQ